jgi:hypothetical protein
MVVLVKPQHHRVLVSRIVRHKEIAAVANENALRIEKAIGSDILTSSGMNGR